MVCGHKPVGDSPLLRISNASEGYLELIVADTSFSDPASADNRGCAIAEVCLLATDVTTGTTPSCSQAIIHGVLHDGAAYSFQTPLIDCAGRQLGPGDAHVGKVTPDGFLIKAKLVGPPPGTATAEGAWYRGARTKDRENEYADVSELQLLG